MIHSIVSIDDIFYSNVTANNSIRSSNPYDYINDGFFLDNVINGGKLYVHYNNNISGYRTGYRMDNTNK